MQRIKLKHDEEVALIAVLTAVFDGRPVSAGREKALRLLKRMRGRQMVRTAGAAPGITLNG